MKDYISREDAIMVAGDMLNSLTGISCKDGENTAREYFKCIPSTDIRENVRGEWITTYLDHVTMGERPKILYCSVCNQCIAYPTNYCPNCGAEMGEKND